MKHYIKQLQYCFTPVMVVLLLLQVGCGGGGSGSNSLSEIPNPEIPDTRLDAVSASEGTLFTYDLGAQFTSDSTFVLNINVSGEQQALPDWLHVDADRALLFGVAGAEDVGSLEILIDATASGASATRASLPLTVSALVSPLTALEVAADAGYIDALMLKESRFLAPGVGFNATTAMTHDGIEIDRTTLQPNALPRDWSAASKESLHVSILAKAILGNTRAQILIAGDDIANATNITLDILEKKITSYETFDTEYPSFGGFLPWFVIEDRGNGEQMYPKSDWVDRIPALDNGQLAWALYVAHKSLAKMGHVALAARYEAQVNKMANNAKAIFFNADNNTISTVSNFVDSSLLPSEQTYIKDAVGLTDSFEGELMVVFMTLFSSDLTPDEKQTIWANKFINTLDYMDASGVAITAVEGWAFSSHEQWKFFVLPYLDNSKARDLFLNGEKIRADYSNQNDFAGFFASVHDSQLIYTLGGVPSMASLTTGVNNTVVAPYATFPMLITDHILKDNTGLDWLRSVLASTSMVGDYGVTEAYDVNPYAIAPILTWDGKVTTDLAIIGGTFTEVREFLIEDGLYLDFLDTVEGEYNKVTQPVLGTELALAGPLSAPPVDPCDGVVLDTNIISDFECQRNHPLSHNEVVANPDVSGVNVSPLVGQYDDPTGPWDALIIDYGQPIDLSTHNQLKIKVWAPVQGILKAKLEGGSSAPIEKDLTVTQLDTWVEYSFDFLDQATESHNKIVFFFNAGASTAGTDVYYIDDIMLAAP